jgi:tetratricopeptide (TPR) repeat protein
VEAHREQLAVVAAIRKNAHAAPPPMRQQVADIFYHLGKIQQALGHKEQARKSFEEALTYDRNHEDTRKELK